jgi:integrase
MPAKRAPNNMGSISQRKSDGLWEGKVSYRREDGKKARKTVYGKTEREVREQVVMLLSTIQRGLPVRGDERMTVESYLNSWLQTKRVRPATTRQYGVSIRVHLIPALGGHRLTKLTPQHIREWMATKEKKGNVSPTTIKLALSVLKSALSQAESDGLVPRNVAKLVKPPQCKQYEAAFLTPEQARLFLAAIQGHRLEALYALLLTVGLRKGEALGLSWGDIDFASSKLHVRSTLVQLGNKLTRSDPKTKGSVRTIKLAPNLVTLLRKHRVGQLEERLCGGYGWIGNQWDLVFVSEIGTPLDTTNVSRQADLLLSKAGLTHIRVHDLRHTACALMLLQGVPVHVVSKILGHATPTITLQVYAKVLPTQQDDAAIAMDNLLFG